MPVEQQSALRSQTQQRVRPTTALFLLLFLPAFTGIHARAQAGHGSQTNVQPPCSAGATSSSGNTVMSAPCGGSGGGGGAGGGGTIPPSPTLNWGSFVSESTSGSQYAVGGTSQRYGVGAAVANGYLYVAYTSPDSYIHLTYATAGSGYALNPESPVYLGSGAPIYGAASNPALGTDGQYLYLAWIDNYGNLNYVRSQNAVNGPSVSWQYSATQLRATSGSQIYPLIYSPSIAVLPSPDGSQQTLYISAVAQANPNDQTTRSLWLASLDLSNGQQFPTWTNYQQYTNIGMSPGLGVFNHTLYIAFPALDSSHSLYYYTTTDGTNFTYQTGAASDSSSTTPSLAVFNGYLYMAFRTNDGDHKFIWKYSSDGVNWSGNTSIGQAMGGPPTIVYGLNLQSDPGHLINIFVADDSTQYLYAGETQ